MTCHRMHCAVALSGLRGFVLFVWFLLGVQVNLKEQLSKPQSIGLLHAVHRAELR